MEKITKIECLETAKNRADIPNIEYLSGTSFVYDRIVTDTELKDVIPLVQDKNGEYILRFKNLMSQYYWLVNHFIPSCTYKKLCIRNKEKKWIDYTNYSELKGECVVKFINYDFSVVYITTIKKGELITKIPTPTYIGHEFNGWYDSHSGGKLFDFNKPITTDTKIYAQYIIDTVNVSFVYYVGETETRTVVTINYGESVKNEDVPSPTERYGYTFLYWNGSYTNVKENIEIKAVYEINTYKVNFLYTVELEDEEPQNILLNTQNIKYKHSANIISAPTKSNYTFSEWIDIETNTTAQLTSVTKNIDAVSTYVPMFYVVVFQDWDGSILKVNIDGEELESQKVEYLGDAVLPETPIRENYTFYGWDKPYTGITKDLVINALYSGDNINVTFKLKDLNDVYQTYKVVTISYNGFVTIPDAPSTTEYPQSEYGVFNGWFTTEECDEYFNFKLNIKEDTVVYGDWKTEFSVTFYNWDGSIIDVSGETSNPQYIKYGENADDSGIIPFIKPKEQYAFLNWSEPLTNITKDTKLYPIFDTNETFIVKWVNSLDGEIISQTTVKAGESIKVEDYPKPLEIYGYTFNYWEGDSNYIYSNIIITAKYIINKYTVKYVDYFYNILDSEKYEYNTSGLTTPIISVPDVNAYDTENPCILYTYHYNGKMLTSSGYTPEEVVVNEDITFQAQYDIIDSSETLYIVDVRSWDGSYTLKFEICRGSILDSGWCVSVKESIESAVGSRGEGYEFDGFETPNGIEYPYEDGIEVNENMILIMRYKIKSYNINFIDSVNYETFYTEAVLYNNKIKKPETAPEIEGYGFAGIYYKFGTTTEWNFDNVVTEDLTLVAKYGLLCVINCTGIKTIIPNTNAYFGNAIYIKTSPKVGYNYQLEFNNCPIEVMSEAFLKNKDLLTIEIPDTVKTIGDNCFKECSLLENIIIPDSVETIGDNCFSSCLGLQSVKLGNGLKTIGDYCFNVCNSVTSITPTWTVESSILEFKPIWCLPNVPSYYHYPDRMIFEYSRKYWPVNSIEYSTNDGEIIEPASTVFSGATLLGSNKLSGSSYTCRFVFDGEPESINSGSFNFGSPLTKIKISDSVKVINDGAFEDSSSLTSVIIGNGVEIISDNAFHNCDLLSDVIIGSSVKQIKYSAFSNNDSLQNIIIPDSVETIGDYCFSGCIGLQSVKLGNGLKTIGSYAFQDCSSLTSVTIPNIVESIGYGAFYGCISLTSIKPTWTDSESILTFNTNWELPNVPSYYTYPEGLDSLYYEKGWPSV